jgi:hypothetical protein
MGALLVADINMPQQLAARKDKALDVAARRRTSMSVLSSK